MQKIWTDLDRSGPIWTDLDRSGPIGKNVKKQQQQHTIHHCGHHANINMSLNAHTNVFAPAVDLVNMFWTSFLAKVHPQTCLFSTFFLNLSELPNQISTDFSQFYKKPVPIWFRILIRMMYFNTTKKLYYKIMYWCSYVVFSFQIRNIWGRGVGLARTVPHVQLHTYNVYKFYLHKSIV